MLSETFFSVRMENESKSQLNSLVCKMGGVYFISANLPIICGDLGVEIAL